MNHVHVQPVRMVQLPRRETAVLIALFVFVLFTRDAAYPMSLKPLYPDGDVRNKHVILDRSKIDIEAMAQRHLSYVKVNSEEGQYLRDHPAEKDRMTALLYKDPRVSDDISPYSIVPMDGDPEQYLEAADEALRAPAHTVAE